MESLKVEECSSVIITTQNEHTKNLISQSVTEYNSEVNIIIKVDSDEERHHFENMKNIHFIDSNYELSSGLVALSLKNLK